MVVTLGPSCRSVEVLTALLEAGMACARIDLTVCASVCAGMTYVGTIYDVGMACMEGLAA